MTFFLSLKNPFPASVDDDDDDDDYSFRSNECLCSHDNDYTESNGNQETIKERTIITINAFKSSSALPPSVDSAI